MKKTTFLFFLLVFVTLKIEAQAVSSYLFSQSSETYSPVLGNNSQAIGDDGIDNGLPIGFDFTFGGIAYSTFSISTNGFIRLGTNISGQSWTNNLANTAVQRPLIAAFWDDNNRGSGSIQYVVSGAFPNRILEIDWNSINTGGSGATSGSFFSSFKMRLYETNGQIDFVYGPGMSPAGTLSASIGINDMSSFLSVSAMSSVASASSVVANNTINTAQFLPGQKFTFTPQEQCVSTPVPGNAVASVASSCNNVNFMLSLENTIPGSGISYQWESSVDGTNFTPITGANSATVSVNQTQTQSYHCIVSCGANTATSNPVTVQSNQALCFCLPTYTNGKTDGDLISNIAITGTTLSNNTGTAPVNPSYTFFTGQSNYTATLEAGHSYEMNVTVGTYQNQNDAVWIDYNDDGVFAQSERVGYSGVIGANGTGIFTITLSCDALPGAHRMRIRDVWSTEAATIDPCANYGYGETEDYMVSIVAAPGCMAPFDLATVLINPNSAELTWQSGCGQISWDLHITPTGGGLPTSEPSNPNVANTFVAGGLQPLTMYDFYVRSNCGANGQSDWSDRYTFTTAAPGPANDDCETAMNLVPGGTFEEHAVVATNVSATKSLGQPNPTCAIFGFGGDVWFNTVVPADGNVTIEVRPDLGSLLLDTGMTVFSGSCGNFTTLGCSDDEGEDAFSMLSLTGLTPGETIYARVWEYANDTFGTFQVAAWNPALKTIGFDENTMKLYPNPVKDILNVSYIEDIRKIEIYNLLGQQLINDIVAAHDCKIDMAVLAKGTYLVKIYSNEKTKTIKVIKE